MRFEKSLQSAKSASSDVAVSVGCTEETAARPYAASGLDIVVIGINYAPELAGIGPYTAGIAQHYAQKGHRVRVVTGIPHYPEWRRRRLPVSDNGPWNPAVTRYSHFVPRRPDVLGRTLYEVTWLLSASRSVITTRADAIIGVIPSLSGGLLALLLAKKLQRPYGVIFQDLLGSAASQSGYSGAVTVAGVARSIEMYVARRAQAVAIVADGFRSYLERNGTSASKIHRVRNWTRANPPGETVAETRARLGWRPSEFICLHAGNMGQKQGLENLLRAAAVLNESNVRMVLAGGGNDFERLVGIVQRDGLTNISFLPVQPEGRYEAMLKAADVLVVNQRASVEDMALPSKLTSYMAAGRPIVAAVSPRSETAREIQLARAGIVVQPNDPSQLAKALLRFATSAEAYGEMANQAGDYVTSCLTAENALPAYDWFLNELIQSHGKTGLRPT